MPLSGLGARPGSAPYPKNFMGHRSRLCDDRFALNIQLKNYTNLTETVSKNISRRFGYGYHSISIWYHSLHL